MRCLANQNDHLMECYRLADMAFSTAIEMDPTNWEYKNQTAVNLINYGRLLKDGESGVATSLVSRSIDLLNEIIGEGEIQLVWMRNRIVAYQLLAEIQFFSDEEDNAVASLGTGFQFLDNLTAVDSGNLEDNLEALDDALTLVLQRREPGVRLSRIIQLSKDIREKLKGAGGIDQISKQNFEERKIG